jgi:hypothetical protein
MITRTPPLSAPSLNSIAFSLIRRAGVEIGSFLLNEFEFFTDGQGIDFAIFFQGDRISGRPASKANVAYKFSGSCVDQQTFVAQWGPGIARFFRVLVSMVVYSRWELRYLEP